MATEKLSEQEIQLRKRARRRLVGAVALVLLMVTVLPMILDDRETQTQQPEIAVNIPSQESSKEFTSKVVPAAPVEPAAPAPTAKPDMPSAVAPAPQPDPEAAPVEQTPPKPVAAETKPAEAPATKPEPAVKPEKTEIETKSAEPKGDFSVQIGVFSDAGNVKQLQAKLKDQGYKSYTEKLSTSTGDKIRLRVGPYGSRAEAEKARDKLKAAGTAGIVVAK
jgi:DedD protein